MSYSNQTRNDERKEEKPPHSRIFVVCGKHFREEELRPHFEKFGEVEDLFIPRDRNSGDSKGVAYIKYAKTSSAAMAIQELHLKTIENYSKPIKVMIANNKNDCSIHNEDRYKRLFIKVPKQASESDIRKYFAEFGQIESVRIQRDKFTEESKGFAYVQYKSFVDAAKAFEECERQYRPVFATPKDELKRSRSSLDTFGDGMQANDSFGNGYNMHNMHPFKQNSPGYPSQNSHNIKPMIKTPPDGYTTVSMTCSPQVAQNHVEKLFNIIPGMQQFQYTVDTYNGFCKALVTYSDESAAAHAVARINNYEFPSGEIVSVKPEKNQLSKVANDLTNMMNNFKKSLNSGSPDLIQLADAIAHASTLIKQATCSKMDQHEVHNDSEDFCNVMLPPSQPLLESNSRVAKRCFIVCKPQPPPISVLRDVFSRFGDLIDVSTFPNKTFGFAKYGSIRAADDAIKTLNGAIVCGIRVKVLEADERPARDDQKVDEDDDDVGGKRIRIDK